MRTLGIIVVGIVALIGGAVVWWESQTPTYAHRFRLVIEVEAGGVLHSGSSVIDVRITDNKFGSPEMKGLRPRVRGDAVFVDLGGGKHVIATLGFGPAGNEDWIAGLTEGAFLPSHPGLRFWDVPGLTGTAPLIGKKIPTLVTFADLNDPKSARVVGVTDFESVFGPDVHFKRAFVEMVPVGWWPFSMLGWPRAWAGEPVTRSIETRLPWLPHVEIYRTNPNNPFSNTLRFGRPLFTREF
jgi:hypothetical protein